MSTRQGAVAVLCGWPYRRLSGLATCGLWPQKERRDS